MLACMLRLLIALELLLYAALALRCLQLSALGAALFALSALFAVRLGVTALTFALSFGQRSPSPRLGWRRGFALVAGEYLAFVTNFVFISPFERCWMGADRLAAGASRPPLLLIHGYGCSRAAWWWLRRRLEVAGWTVATVNLEPLWTDIDNYVDTVSRRVDEVLARTGASQLVLVGHSMGGLVARACLQRHGAARVCRLVTLGTPHGGSRLARLGFGRNARQMEPGNPWLLALGGVAAPVGVVTIYSRHDNYVVPQTNLLLPGAESRVVDGVGHLSMLFSSRVLGELLAALPALQGDAVAGAPGRDRSPDRRSI